MRIRNSTASSANLRADAARSPCVCTHSIACVNTRTVCGSNVCLTAGTRARKLARASAHFMLITRCVAVQIVGRVCPRGPRERVKQRQTHNQPAEPPPSTIEMTPHFRRTASETHGRTSTKSATTPMPPMIGRTDDGQTGHRRRRRRRWCLHVVCMAQRQVMHRRRAHARTHVRTYARAQRNAFAFVAAGPEGSGERTTGRRMATAQRGWRANAPTRCETCLCLLRLVFGRGARAHPIRKTSWKPPTTYASAQPDTQTRHTH